MDLVVLLVVLLVLLVVHPAGVYSPQKCYNVSDFNARKKLNIFTGCAPHAAGPQFH